MSQPHHLRAKPGCPLGADCLDDIEVAHTQAITPAHVDSVVKSVPNSFETYPEVLDAAVVFAVDKQGCAAHSDLKSPTSVVRENVDRRGLSVGYGRPSRAHHQRN